MSDLIATKEYTFFLERIKQDIQAAQQRAHFSVNQELILLYRRIGAEIIKRKQDLGWGSEVVKFLAADLKHTFPHMRGLSQRNLVYMQTLAKRFSESTAQNPMGVAQYRIVTKKLPKKYAEFLPSTEQFQRLLDQCKQKTMSF